MQAIAEKIKENYQKEELENYVRDLLDEKVIIFLINKEYDNLKKFAELCNVSEKMIYLYINEYYLPLYYPKFHRKKEGGYKVFKVYVDELVRDFVKYIQRKARKLGIDEKEMADTLIEFVKEKF